MHSDKLSQSKVGKPSLSRALGEGDTQTIHMPDAGSVILQGGVDLKDGMSCYDERKPHTIPRTDPRSKR